MLEPAIFVGSRPIGPGHLPYIVAEIACAHEGELARARRLLRAVARTGADAVQLQLFRADQLVAHSHPDRDLVSSLELSAEAWRELWPLARAAAPHLWATVLDRPSLELALDLGSDAIKLHATDLASPDLLTAAARSGLPVALSAGGATADELQHAVQQLRCHGAAFLLMHGYQAYPTPVVESDLGRIPLLRRLFNCPVGFQDHVAGDSPQAHWLPAAAIGAGADVIEKHLIDDRSRGGIDHQAALEPESFAQLVDALRTLGRARGSGGWAPLSEGELAYRRRCRRSIVAARPLHEGRQLRESDLRCVRAVNAGLAPTELNRLIGGRLLRNVDQDHLFELRDVVPAAAPSTVRQPHRRRSRPRVIACLVARVHSRRLPRKSLRPIAGIPLLERLAARIRRAESVDRVVICTSTHPDDSILLDAAADWGVEAFAGSENDVLSRLIAAGRAHDASLLVRVTGDNVLTDAPSIDPLVERVVHEGSDYARVVDMPLGATPEVMTLPFLLRLHREVEDPAASEYLLFEAFRPERYRCSVVRASPEVRRPGYALTVDTPQDLDRMERLFRALPGDVAGPSLADACRFLDDDPDYHGIPADAPIKLPQGQVWTFSEYLAWHDAQARLAGCSPSFDGYAVPAEFR